MEQKFPRKSQAVKTYISTRMKAVDFEKGKIKAKHSAPLDTGQPYVGWVAFPAYSSHRA